MKTYPLKEMLWNRLMDNPMSTQELANYLGCSLRYAQEYMAAIRAMGTIERKRLKIVDWYTATEQKRSGSPAPIYAVGYGKDAPKPAPLSSAELSKRNWQKFGAIRNAKRRVNKSIWSQLI